MKHSVKMMVACITSLMTLAIGTVTAYAVNPNSASAGPCGSINGEISVSSATPRKITVESWTTYGYAVPKSITVDCDVDDYHSGALIFSLSNSDEDTDYVKKVREQAIFVDLQVSAFAAHTCTKNGVGYGCYTSKTNFTI